MVGNKHKTKSVLAFISALSLLACTFSVSMVSADETEVPVTEVAVTESDDVEVTESSTAESEVTTVLETTVADEIETTVTTLIQEDTDKKVSSDFAVLFHNAQNGAIAGTTITVDGKMQRVAGNSAADSKLTFGDVTFTEGETKTVTLSALPSAVTSVSVNGVTYRVSNGSVTFDVSSEVVDQIDGETVDPFIRTVYIDLIEQANFLSFTVLSPDNVPVSGAQITGTLYQVPSYDSSYSEGTPYSDLISVYTNSFGDAVIPCPAGVNLYMEYEIFADSSYVSSKTPVFTVDDSVYLYNDILNDYTPVEKDPDGPSSSDSYYKQLNLKPNYLNFDEVLTATWGCTVEFVNTENEDDVYILPLTFTDTKDFDIYLPAGVYKVKYNSGDNFEVFGADTVTVKEDKADFQVDLKAVYVVSVHKLKNNSEVSWSFTYNGKTYTGTGSKRFAVAKGLNYLLDTPDGPASLNSINENAVFDLSSGTVKNASAEKLANAPKTGDFMKVALGVLAAGGLSLGGYAVYRKKRGSSGSASDDIVFDADSFGGSADTNSNSDYNSDYDDLI